MTILRVLHRLLRVLLNCTRGRHRGALDLQRPLELRVRCVDCRIRHTLGAVLPSASCHAMEHERRQRGAGGTSPNAGERRHP